MTRMSLSLVLALGLVLQPLSAVADEWIGSGDCQARLLHPTDEDELPAKYEGLVAEPFDTHRLMIREAMAVMTPLTCAALQRIVLVKGIRGHTGEEGWVDPDDPDLVNINLETIDPVRRTTEELRGYNLVKGMQAVLHEATHSADFLLLAHAEESGLLGGLAGQELYKNKWITTTPSADDWPADAQRTGREMVKLNRLGGSLRAEWKRLQEQFVSVGLGGPYLGPRVEGESHAPAALAGAGFTSRYGAQSPGEDIAEFASWMLAAPLLTRDFDGRSMPARGVDNYACRRMQAHDKTSVPGELALLYTKASLLLSTGLVSQEAFDLCVGKLKLEQPGEGLFAWEFVGDPSEDNVQLRRNFPDLQLSIASHPNLDQHVFLLEALGTASYAGEEIPSTVRMRVALAHADHDIDLVSWPRGIYDLSAFGNRFAVEVDDTPSASFHATKALLLVPYATNQRIEGSIFLQQALRSSRPPVPQTGLPMRFTFSKQK